jgi:hypothetical protein
LRPFLEYLAEISQNLWNQNDKILRSIERLEEDKKKNEQFQFQVMNMLSEILGCLRNGSTVVGEMPLNKRRLLSESSDTSNHANASMDAKTLTINEISSQTSLTFSVASPQTYPTAVTPTCSVIAGVGSAVLQLDGNTISSFTSGGLTLAPLGGEDVSLTLTGTGDFIVNTDDLFVDTSSGFVGIGTASPTAWLDLPASDATGAGTRPDWSGTGVVEGARVGATEGSGLTSCADFKSFDTIAELLDDVFLSTPIPEVTALSSIGGTGGEDSVSGRTTDIDGSSRVVK